MKNIWNAITHLRNTFKELIDRADGRIFSANVELHPTSSRFWMHATAGVDVLLDTSVNLQQDV